MAILDEGFKDNNVNIDQKPVNHTLTQRKDGLEFTQADLDAALSDLEENELEFKNSKLALANSEYARQGTKVELDKELSSHAETKLKLQNIKDALVNSERARQEANRNRVLPRPSKEQEVFVVVQFQTPQSRFCIFTMQRQTIDRVLKHFVLRGNDDTEPEMIEYITKVFNTYTKDSSAAAIGPESD
ncbi:hypothetical protein BGX27_010910 [Mortierella sp. AM989]|nr:hypothetical protein BGX27_010910 [Mortierella sp. AM989]